MIKLSLGMLSALKPIFFGDKSLVMNKIHQKQDVSSNGRRIRKYSYQNGVEVCGLGSFD
jgi:hypothetical protein